MKTDLWSIKNRETSAYFLDVLIITSSHKSFIIRAIF